MKVAFRLALCTFLCLAGIVLAADRPDFSGSYTQTGSKGSAKFDKRKVQTLNVLQTETSIEVTEVTGGHANLNKYPLDGQEVVYTSPGGVRGMCKGQFKKNYLILESVVTVRQGTGGPATQLRTTQRWELSADLKTLTIHVDVNSPQSPINLFEPWTEIYTRD